MVLSAVVTTSASSAAMKEATEVRASTAAFADLALESVMNSFLIGCKDGRQRSTHRRRPLLLGRMRMGKGCGAKFFRSPESFGYPRASSAKQAVVGIGDVLRRGRRLDRSPGSMPMKRTLVRYKTRPEQAEENE